MNAYKYLSNKHVSYVIFIMYVYLRDRQGEISYPLVHTWFSKVETHFVFPKCVAGIKSFGHHQLLARVRVSRKLEQHAELRLKMSHFYNLHGKPRMT